jgi:hypothetical protein
MKKTLTLLLVFLAWTTSLSAQNTREQADVPQGAPSSYLPIITPDKIWHIEAGGWCAQAPPNCECYYGLLTIIIGDTKILNEKEYYELMFDNQNVITYIREEEGKLFFYSEYCNEEYLMYDFTLNVGDTFFFYDPYDPWPNPCELTEADIYWCSFVVGETSEIEYNQVKRKKIRLDWLLFPDGFQDTWVEGIGNMRGICFNFAQQLSGGRRLKDCYESDQLIFKNEEPFCWFYVGTNDRQEELINIFADENNTLRIMNAKDIPLTMYDIQGRNIKSIIPTEDNYALNISNLPKGLYIVGNETKGITFKVIVR